MLLLVVGMFIEANAAIIILIPILFPVAMELGIDPLHLGVVIVVNMGLGLVDPAGGPEPDARLGDRRDRHASRASGASGGCLLAGLTVLMLLTFVPVLTTWPPGIAF